MLRNLVCHILYQYDYYSCLATQKFVYRNFATELPLIIVAWNSAFYYGSLYCIIPVAIEFSRLQVSSLLITSSCAPMSGCWPSFRDRKGGQMNAWNRMMYSLMIAWQMLAPFKAPDLAIANPNWRISSCIKLDVLGSTNWYASLHRDQHLSKVQHFGQQSVNVQLSTCPATVRVDVAQGHSADQSKWSPRHLFFQLNAFFLEGVYAGYTNWIKQSWRKWN